MAATKAEDEHALQPSSSTVGYGATAANGVVERQPAAAPPTNASPRSSIGRVPDGKDTDDNSVDFVVSATPTVKAMNG